eukprot:4036166-Alexandrium_andersonii.AAC.1
MGCPKAAQLPNLAAASEKALAPLVPVDLAVCANNHAERALRLPGLQSTCGQVACYRKTRMLDMMMSILERLPV